MYQKNPNEFPFYIKKQLSPYRVKFDFYFTDLAEITGLSVVSPHYVFMGLIIFAGFFPVAAAGVRWPHRNLSFYTRKKNETSAVVERNSEL